MSGDKPFSPQARVRSLVYAFRGLAHVVKTQHNMWLHLVVACGVIALGFGLRVGRADWLWLIAAIALVIFAELINSAIEFLCDVVSPDHNPAVEKAKDIGAAAVLVVAFASILIGLMVFWPHLL
jgi:diacylglycerol kinase (ATP)